VKFFVECIDSGLRIKEITMARMAKKPIEIPKGVKINTENNLLTIEGPKGSLNHRLMPGLKAVIQDNKLSIVTVQDSPVDPKTLNAHLGLTHSLVKNIVQGVTTGFEKKMEIQGIGYRASLEKGNLTLSLGFTRPVVMELPKGITVDIDKQVNLTIKGIDKYLVGETAAKIRRVKPPEVYKGTGIRFLGEYVRKKIGKTGATATAKSGGKE
jgi:large subunit ribosomal protein L6